MGLILLSFTAFLIFGGMFFAYWYYNTDNVGKMFFEKLDWLDYSLILSQLFAGTIFFMLSLMTDENVIEIFGFYIQNKYIWLYVGGSAYIVILIMKARYKIKLSIFYDRNFVAFFTIMTTFFEQFLSLLLTKLF